jgi:hypothetical protein
LEIFGKKYNLKGIKKKSGAEKYNNRYKKINQRNKKGDMNRQKKKEKKNHELTEKTTKIIESIKEKNKKHGTNIRKM